MTYGDLTCKPAKGCGRRSLVAAAVTAMLAGTSLPAQGAIPEGVEGLLRAANDSGLQSTFRVILDTALAAYPGDRLELLKLAEEIAGAWMRSERVEEIRLAEEAAAATLAREKARGIAYILDPKYWAPSIELGFGNSTGDTSEVAASLGIGLSREFETWMHKIDFLGDFARRTGLTTRQRFTLAAESAYTGFGRWQAINYLLFEADRFSGFDFRVTDTVQLGYKLLDGEQHKLRLGIGPGVRFSVLDDELDPVTGAPVSAGTETEFLGRLSADYAYKISDTFSLNEVAGVVLSTGSTRLDNELNLTARLNSRLQARLRFIVNFESDVPVDTSNADTSTRITVAYTF